MIINWRIPGTLLISLILGLTACSSNKVSRNSSSGGKSAVSEARGGCGNEASYSINGKTYKVLGSSVGYAETGTASWYGAEYQGTETAGCEIFDMNGYSAAHRTLPLPSFAKVTNQQNGKSMVVRINDRGPFESDDLIQLSFAAANALGITSRSGTPVSVEALGADQVGGQHMVSQGRQTAKAKKVQPVDKSRPYYVIAGNWADRNGALDMFVRLTSVGLAKTEMISAQQKGRNVHQVRVGPLYNQDQIDNVKDMLGSNGLSSFKVVEAR